MPSENRLLRTKLIRATDAALRSVNDKRFFQTERGFHGRFYCALQNCLDNAKLLTNGAIVELEYQKSARHGTCQRPDIVSHIPAEHSASPVSNNNFAVWLLKRKASLKAANEDFLRLDEMFELLNYPLGFFINVDSQDPMGQHYSGKYPDQLLSVAACLADGA